MSPSHGGECRLYVSLRGDDSWSGTHPEPTAGEKDGPFASLQRAIQEVRELRSREEKTITVFIRGGLYYLQSPLRLAEDDSGSSKAPVIYRSFPNERARIIGGMPVHNWTPVGDAHILSRLESSARRHLVQSDLRELGLNAFGKPDGPGLELFFQDRPMTLARYPNKGFMRIRDVAEKNGHQIHGISGSRVGRFHYYGNRPARWMDEKDPWLHGYWFWDWSDQRQRIASIDPERKLISLLPPHHAYGYRKGQWFYAFNMLCELDTPGEWYLDREKGVLYFWPPSDLKNGNPTVAVLDDLVVIEDASHIRLEGLVLEVARGNGIVVQNARSVQIAGCEIRNVQGWAVRMDGGRENAVLNCHIHDVGAGGIELKGGDRETLTGAAHLAECNHIHSYGRWKPMYSPAISLQGVGNRAAHNLIHHAPHQAISFSGNEHRIEFNEIHHVCLESNDAGAIYAGRDWTQRGTIIKHNFLHHVKGFEGRGAVGIYLDDMFCGTTIYGNVFYRVTRAAFIGGGRDNMVENNIFVDCDPAVHVDARAMGWARYHLGTTMTQRLLAVPYRESPWRERYPQLLCLLDDDPAAPKGNMLIRNVC